MKLLQSFLFTFSLILLLSLLCYGQVKVRKIEKRSTKNEPIELVSAEVGDLPFNNENQVLADKSWLKNLKLNVKNISGKTIVYMKVNLEFSAQGKMQYPLLLPLVFGHIPPPDSASSNSDLSNLKILRPNQSVKISIIPSVLNKFAGKFAPENEILDIEQVRFFFDFVIFDDGTAWSRGRQMRRNPDDPNRWQRMRIEQPGANFLHSFFNLSIPLRVVNNWWESNNQTPLFNKSEFFWLIIQTLLRH